MVCNTEKDDMEGESSGRAMECMRLPWDPFQTTGSDGKNFPAFH